MHLRLRIFLSLAAVAIASVLVTALMTRGGVRRVVEAYVLQKPATDPSAEAALIGELAEVLEESWTEASGFPDAAEQITDFFETGGRGTLLTDAAGDLVAAAGAEVTSVSVGAPSPEGLEVVEWRTAAGELRRMRGGRVLRSPTGRRIGLLLMLPAGSPEDRVSLLKPQGAIDRRIAAAAGIALLFAIVAAFVISRHIAQPLSELAGATRRLAAGGRPERIEYDRQDEVGQLVTAFNELTGSLENSEALRRRLVADVAHELRTPLAGLQGNIEAMIDGLVQPDQNELARLHGDVAHLTGLVAELQELALAEAGEIRIEAEPLDLAEEVRRAAASVGLGDEGVEGRPAFHLTGVSGTVLADSGRLRQILTNLLSNALVHAEASELVVAMAVRPDLCAVTISDNGRGIDAEALPLVFERLYQADTTGAGRPGWGLGLAITRELVRAHGGTITVESTPGSGTTFTIELPTGGIRDMQRAPRPKAT